MTPLRDSRTQLSRLCSVDVREVHRCVVHLVPRIVDDASVQVSDIDHLKGHRHSGAGKVADMEMEWYWVKWTWNEACLQFCRALKRWHMACEQRKLTIRFPLTWCLRALVEEPKGAFEQAHPASIIF